LQKKFDQKEKEIKEKWEFKKKEITLLFKASKKPFEDKVAELEKIG
jgi:hypothetical protein